MQHWIFPNRFRCHQGCHNSYIIHACVPSSHRDQRLHYARSQREREYTRPNRGTAWEREIGWHMTGISPSPVGLMDGLNYAFIYFCINVFCALIFLFDCHCSRVEGRVWWLYILVAGRINGEVKLYICTFSGGDFLFVIIQESKGKYAGYMSVLVGLMDMLTRGIALIGLLWGLLLRHSRVEGQGAYDASISFSVYGDAYIWLAYFWSWQRYSKVERKGNMSVIPITPSVFLGIFRGRIYSIDIFANTALFKYQRRVR